MTISDEDLARARNVGVDQVRQLRETRGTTNDTLDAMSEAGFRRAVLRLSYPDRPAMRAEFRLLQTLGDGATAPPPRAV